jgi:hypothetical protein
MHTVTIRLSDESFSTATVRMRNWLEEQRCEPTGYRYDQNDGHRRRCSRPRLRCR